MSVSPIDLIKAKFEIAQSEADIADAEVRAAHAIADAEAKALHAQLNVARAKLEYLQAMQEHGGSPKPSPHGSPRGTGALESSPSPAVMVVTVPSQKSDAAGSSILGPNYTALRAELDGTTAYGSAGLGREASIPRSPSPPVSDLRGPFMKFGRVRIRLWYVCLAGGDFPCGIMTTDERFKYDWSVTPVRTGCCAKDVTHIYRQKWKSIMQISVLGEEFLTTMDAPTWNTDILMYQGICKQAEMARYSESHVKKEIREARKFTFEQVFRRAQKDEVKPCVDLQKTWVLKPNIPLPDWDLHLLHGVVKHCR